MSALQLNSEFFFTVGKIADEESLMAKLLKYAKKLAASKEDSTRMTKEEFYARVEKAEKQYERGEYTTTLPGESVSDMLKRCGYAI